uniref:MIF4G domain-containing protein n=1 Tax=Macrostomum lignano TaxID=282301 RepID=A0A1I8H7D2_9PLAT
GGGGGGSSVVPDVAAHEWNVNVADFVPAPSAAGVGGPSTTASASAAAPSGDDAAAQLAAGLISSLRSAGDRQQMEVKMGASLTQLRRWAKTRSDCEQLVRSVVRLASSDRGLCDLAAELLAYLALNFTVTEKLFDRSSPLSNLPFYLALMRHCSVENDALCRHLVAQKTATEEKAGYALFFCLLYACLPSPTAPTDRQQAIARSSLQILNLLAGLSDCPAGFRAIQSALLSVGEILDIDCANSAAGAVNGGGEDSASPAGQLENLYDQLRQAVAHCRIGDVALATDIIRLLELRASGWGRPPAGFAAAGSVSNASQSMTDDMYADYEQFLRESGQL